MFVHVSPVRVTGDVHSICTAVNNGMFYERALTESYISCTGTTGDRKNTPLHKEMFLFTAQLTCSSWVLPIQLSDIHKMQKGIFFLSNTFHVSPLGHQGARGQGFISPYLSLCGTLVGY